MESTFLPQPTTTSTEDILSGETTSTTPVYKPIVTGELLSMFKDHCDQRSSMLGIPKFWALKSFLKNYRTVAINAGSEEEHTLAGLEFTRKFNNPVFICLNDKTYKQTLTYCSRTDVSQSKVISANNFDSYIKSVKEIDLFVIDSASQYPSLDVLYDAFMYAGVGENTFILFLK